MSDSDLAPIRFSSFNGKEVDSSTGLIYFGARYLDPKFGRWLNPDPLSRTPRSPCIMSVAECNPYVFGRNNPVTFADNVGLMGGVGSAELRGAWRAAGRNPGIHNADQAEMNAVYTGILVGLLETMSFGIIGVDMPSQNIANNAEAQKLQTTFDTSREIGRGFGVAAAIGLSAPRSGSAQPARTARARAEGALADELVHLGSKPLSKQPAVTVGAADPVTGEVAVGRSSPGRQGCCAEVDAAAQLPDTPPGEIVFTKPVRPRTGRSPGCLQDLSKKV